jgi:O-antigen ligase
MIEAAIVVIIAWGALAFGAVYEWAYVPLLVACAAVGLLGFAVGRRRQRPLGHRTVFLSLVVTAVAVGAQLFPVPAGVLQAVSPSADAFLQQHNVGYAIERPSHPLSINPQATILGLAFLLTFVLFLAGMLRGLSRRSVRRLVPAIIAFGVVLALIGIIQKAVLGDHTFMGMKIYGFWVPESRLVVPYGPYVNRNHFAGWMLMGIPLAFALFCALWQEGAREAEENWRERLLWFSSPQGGRAILVGFAIVIMTLSLAMSMSRSGMAALAIAAVFIGWRLLRTLPGRVTRIAAVTLLAALITLPILWVGIDDTVNRFSSDAVGSVQMRVHVWRDTQRLIRDFLVTGSGLNTFGTAMIVYQSGTLDVHFQEAHNDYLQILAEGGLLVGIPALIALVFVIRAIYRGMTARDEDLWINWVRVGAATGLMAIAVQSLVEFSLQMPGNAAFFTVLLALAMFRPDQRRIRPS